MQGGKIAKGGSINLFEVTKLVGVVLGANTIDNKFHIGLEGGVYLILQGVPRR